MAWGWLWLDQLGFLRWLTKSLQHFPPRFKFKMSKQALPLETKRADTDAKQQASEPRRVVGVSPSLPEDTFPSWGWVSSFFFSSKLVFIYLAVPGLSCGRQALVLPPWMEPRCPALGAQSLSHWTTREVPLSIISMSNGIISISLSTVNIALAPLLILDRELLEDMAHFVLNLYHF